MKGISGCLYDTDRLAIGLLRSLVRDFRRFFGKDFQSGIDNASSDIRKFREQVCTDQDNISYYLRKCVYQVHNLLKKYRFKNDVFVDSELEEITYKKYCDFQKQLSEVQNKRQTSYLVLQRARVIAKRILGEFSEEDIYRHLKFGKKSSIGCPLHLAHIDHKLGDVRAFTGSSEMFKWFRENIISNDTVAQRIYNRLLEISKTEHRHLPLDIESLGLKMVPKTWKILRVITPLALLNLFYSHGLGGLVTERLAAAGLNISSLQARHRRLIADFSKTRSHATADLSSASDSLTKEICRRVLPLPWYRALQRVTTHQLEYFQGDKKIELYTQSILPMGNGCTFPFETLIFYCVLKAISELTETTGIISVYGDDLIYPSKMHRYVAHVFSDIGFFLNPEKTFVHSPFRESCGADFCSGFDVRSFYFKGEQRDLDGPAYMSLLYKTYNGLTVRWHESEISGTLYFLITEMCRTGLSIMRIPPSYPAYSGVQCCRPNDTLLGLDFLDYSPIKAVFTNGSRWIRFCYITERSTDRYVVYQEPYYWQTLMGDHDRDEPYEEMVKLTAMRLGNRIGCLVPSSTPVFIWHETKKFRTWRNKGKLYRKQVVQFKGPYVPSRKHTNLMNQTGSVSDWV